MKTKLMLKSALLVMALSLVSACGSAELAKENNQDDSTTKVEVAKKSNLVMVARKDQNSNKLEVAFVSPEKAASQEAIKEVFAKGQRRDISELESDLMDSSSNQCYGCGGMVMARPTFGTIYQNEFGRCGNMNGCFWFPGKYALRFAGRVLNGVGNLVGRTLNGVGNLLWDGANAVCQPNGYWNNAFISYRDQGCASYTCSTFWAPTAQPIYAQPFVSQNYGYTVYEETSYEKIKEVSYPGYYEFEHQNDHRVETNSISNQFIR